MHIGQTEIATAVAKRQLFVVEAKQVQQRRMQVVDVHAVLDRLEAEVVRLTVAHAALRAAAGEEHTEAMRVVVAAVAILAHRRATKLAAPHDQRVIQQAALLQVAQQRRDGLVNVLAQVPRARVVVRVRVPRLPVAVINLDEPHAPLGEPPRHEAAVRKMALAVKFARRRRFARDVERIRRGELHPIRRLHCFDAALQRRVHAAARRATPILAGERAVPAHLRDPGGHWFGFSKRARIVVVAKGRATPEEAATYEQLADPRLKGVPVVFVTRYDRPADETRALELGAAAIILVHNHPSGDPTPSKADIEMTRDIAIAAKALGITVHDHLVIGRKGHASFKSLNLL